jgi:bifunctional non-homologous end joining protein LigD
MPSRTATKTTKKKRSTASLVRYNAKRDFTTTPEPAGRKPARRGAERQGPLHFVVQKHAASHVHFDLRLELDGVMKSWAVPKGPSLDPGVRRLAVQVEDHPIEYNQFEGTIPAGEYGGGTVMIWDRGTYEPVVPDEDPTAAVRHGYERGDLKIIFHGERLRGSWVLVRTRRDDAAKPQWLLIKHRDESADPSTDLVADALTSVASGRTMDEIAAGRAVKKRHASVPARATWTSHASDPAPAKAASTASRKALGAASDVVRQIETIEHDGDGDGTLALGRGVSLEVSHLSKVFFPRTAHARAYTKGDLLRYYATVAPFLLPAIRDRPLVLKRFPNGIAGKAFYQQKAPDDPPPGVRVETIPDLGDGVRHLIGGDLVTLLYTIQLGAVSVDPWHTRTGSIHTPDYTIIDLDPGDEAAFPRVVEVAVLVKEVLDELGLHGVPKTSGATGIHIAIPLSRGTSEESARLAAELIATTVAQRHPKAATVTRGVRSRGSAQVYVDYLQNIRGKTIAGVYAVRAVRLAQTSTPLAWSELTRALRPSAFTIESLPERVRVVGDLWKEGMRRPNNLARIARSAGR